MTITTLKRNIPITVFTGFLGAGKTTLILSLLPRLPNDYKVVLLKNEFGDVEGKTLVGMKADRTSFVLTQWQWTANWLNNLASLRSARY